MSRLRARSNEVKEILGSNYGAKTDGCLPDLTPYIRTANSVVNDIVACALEKGITHSANKLALIETWLAAHYYTRMDPTYKSRSNLRTSGSFNTDGNEYKSVAIDLDSTGCLASLLDGIATLSLGWGGKTEPEQLTYEERN